MGNKQMPGRTYEIISKDDYSATIEATYLCPYCNQEVQVQFTVYSDAFEIIERGGFFEPLTCGVCGKTTDVRFWGNQKI